MFISVCVFNLLRGRDWQEYVLNYTYATHPPHPTDTWSNMKSLNEAFGNETLGVSNGIMYPISAPCHSWEE